MVERERRIAWSCGILLGVAVSILMNESRAALRPQPANLDSEVFVAAIAPDVAAPDPAQREETAEPAQAEGGADPAPLETAEISQDSFAALLVTSWPSIPVVAYALDDPVELADSAPAGPLTEAKLAIADDQTGRSSDAQPDAPCPGRPDALGTSRVLAVNPNEFLHVGTIQYKQTLPLAEREVVLTFDDGPIPPYSDRVLAALAAECVKATFFMVGRHARAFPDRVRKVHQAGHTIGSHSQTHPFSFGAMSTKGAWLEIKYGFSSVANALGDKAAVAPFFRFPGLSRTRPAEDYLADRSIMTWSADVTGDDWYHHITGAEVMHRALARLEVHRKGIILLHDIQPATALMLPEFLRELKKRGYRVVHVVPAAPEPVKNVPVAAMEQAPL